MWKFSFSCSWFVNTHTRNQQSKRNNNNDTAAAAETVQYIRLTAQNRTEICVVLCSKLGVPFEFDRKMRNAKNNNRHLETSKWNIFTICEWHQWGHFDSWHFVHVKSVNRKIGERFDWYRRIVFCFRAATNYCDAKSNVIYINTINYKSILRAKQ